VLEAHVREQRRQVAVEVGQRRPGLGQALAQESPEGHPVRGPVLAVAHDEEHGPVAEVGFEHDGQQAAAVRVDLLPHVEPARHEAVGLAPG
jgi:hypothetical protein